MEIARIKILGDGTHCEPGNTRTDHVGVLIPDANLIIHPYSLGNEDGEYLPNWDACDRACRELRVLDKDDWRFAGPEVWARYMFDWTRRGPAVDTNLYPGIKPDWHWTSQSVVGSPSSAWYVNAYYGYVDDYRRDYGGCALAVRSAGQ